jgi:hypothetical protein
VEVPACRLTLSPFKISNSPPPSYAPSSETTDSGDVIPPAFPSHLYGASSFSKMPQRPKLGSTAEQADALGDETEIVESGQERVAERPRLESAAEGGDLLDASPRMPSARSRSSRSSSHPEPSSAVLGRVTLYDDELEGQDDII